MLRVVLTPDYRGNPYLDLFADALRRSGVSVDHVRELHELDHVDPTKLPDVIHLQWGRHWFVKQRRRDAIRRTMSLLRRLRRVDVAVTWTVHNLRDHEAPHPVLERSARIALGRHVDGVFVHHPAGVDVVRRHLLLPSEVPVSVLPMGPYPADPTIDQLEARRALGIPEDVVVLAAVGSARAYKRLPQLIAAVRRAAQTTYLIVAGTGPEDEVERIRQAAAGDPRVVLHLERQSDRQISQVLRAADAFVNAAKNQFTTSSAVLAMCHGRAVITEQSGHVEHLVGGKRPFSFDQLDVRSMAATIEGLEREALLARGMVNLERAERFSWDEAAAAATDCYRHVRRPSFPGSAWR